MVDMIYTIKKRQNQNERKNYNLTDLFKIQSIGTRDI